MYDMAPVSWPRLRGRVISKLVLSFMRRQEPKHMWWESCPEPRAGPESSRTTGRELNPLASSTLFSLTE